MLGSHRLPYGGRVVSIHATSPRRLVPPIKEARILGQGETTPRVPHDNYNVIYSVSRVRLFPQTLPVAVPVKLSLYSPLAPLLALTVRDIFLAFH